MSSSLAPSTLGRRPPWTTFLPLAVVLLLLFAFCVHTAKRDSVSWDESQHLYSGWLAWEHGDFGYNPEVPPLVKMWDAIPLLHRNLHQPAFTGDEFKKEGFVLGQRFLAANGIDRTLIPARIMASLLTVSLAALLFLCAREMFGDLPALFALLLLCLDPNILANGAYVTTDIGATLATLAAVYTFYRYIKHPGWTRLVVAGLAVGLAMTSKFTGVFIIPILILIAIIDHWSAKQTKGTSSPSSRQLVFAIVFLLMAGVACIWAIYHFRYAARPGSLQLNPASAQYLQELRSSLSRWVLTTISRLHLLPEAYIYGLADTKISASSLPSYFFGRDYAGAPRWYFPAAFVIKSTLPFLILLALTLAVLIQGRWNKRREIIFLAVPAVSFFLLCTSSDLGIGYRHLLPIFPMLYMLIAGCAAHTVSRFPRSIYAFACLLAWQCVTTVVACPGLIAYANEAWGGPEKTHLYLSDSNTDWGQQLKAVKTYLATHPSQPCYFAYFEQGPVDFHDYGINCRVLPTGSALWTGMDTMHFGAQPEISGTVLISDGVLAGADIPGKQNPYLLFHSLHPLAVIDRGVYVYQGHFRLAQAAASEHVRAAMELQQQHKTQPAMQEAREALQLDPVNPEAHSILGDTLAATGDPAGARAEYSAALHSPELDPIFQKGLRNQLLAQAAQ